MSGGIWQLLEARESYNGYCWALLGASGALS